MVEVAWTLEALDDVEAVGAFHERTSPAYASSLVERLYESVAVLEEYPRFGRKVPEIDHDAVRELIVERYRVVYQLMRDRIEIGVTQLLRQRLPSREVAPPEPPPAGSEGVCGGEAHPHPLRGSPLQGTVSLNCVTPKRLYRFCTAARTWSGSSANGEEMHNPPMQRTQGCTAVASHGRRRYLASRPVVGVPCAADWQPVIPHGK